MKPCEHPEASVECFFDSHCEATEHAEWCSICGAYRVNSGYDDRPWTLPKEDFTTEPIALLKQLEALTHDPFRNSNFNAESAATWARVRELLKPDAAADPAGEKIK